MLDLITPAERLQHVTSAVIAIAGIQRSEPDSIWEDPDSREDHAYKQAKREYLQIRRVIIELLDLQTMLAQEIEERHDNDKLPY